MADEILTEASVDVLGENGVVLVVESVGSVVVDVGGVLLEPQRPYLAALPLVSASVTGNAFPNDGHTFFRIINAGSASVTVVFDAPNRCSFGFFHDQTMVVPATGELYEIGPFDRPQFNDIDGLVQVGYTSVTGLTVGAVIY